MRLIVGLGNPGERHEKNRHNVGRAVVDRLVQKSKIKSQNLKSKLESDTWMQFGETEISKREGLVLAKAGERSFMNESGEWVKKLKDFYKVENQDIVIVYDDLDLAMGRVLVSDRGPKIHNGVNSVIEKIGDGFIHVRCGVDDRDGDRSLPGAEYVLRDFPDIKAKGGLIESAVSEIERLT